MTISKEENFVKFSKKDVINKMAEIGMYPKKDCDKFLDLAMESIVAMLKTPDKEVDIAIVGFGNFSNKKVPTRIYKSFGKSMQVEEHRVAKFKFGKTVREYLK